MSTVCLRSPSRIGSTLITEQTAPRVNGGPSATQQPRLEGDAMSVPAGEYERGRRDFQNEMLDTIDEHLSDTDGHPDPQTLMRHLWDMPTMPVDAPRDHGHDYIDIVFDGPPSEPSGRFVDVEDETGASVNAGEWIDSGAGFWRLRISPERLSAST